ncbi:MAG: S8 family serine peptidase [Planctomycetes bacterium]|nr:S8 family serine peptidase [Planctomycetota bacterium]
MHRAERETRQRGIQRWIVELEVAAPDFSVIVSGAESAATQRFADDVLRSRAPIAARLEALGASVVEVFWLVEAIAVEADEVVASRLRGDPAVRRMLRDDLVLPNTVSSVSPWPIKDSTSARNHATDLVQAKGVTGKGGVVAMLDTGVDAAHGNDGRPHRTFFFGGDVRNVTGPGIGGSRLLVNRQAGMHAAENALTHGTLAAGVAVGGLWGTAAADPGHAPGASIASYSVVDDASGAASYTSILKGWQLVISDVAQLGTRVVLFPFAGSPDPMHPTQVALDRAADIQDLLIVVAAGNGGASSRASQAAINGIPVGAVHGQGLRTVWPSSTRGPLATLPKGIYPLMVANGVDIVGPLADAENSDLKDSGTSLAAAQVAGAATWLRAHRSTLTALETKALILATLEDISSFNTTPPFDTRDAYGLGYLREDSLLDAANGVSSIVSSAKLDAVNKVSSVALKTAMNETWSIALVWNRLDTTRLAFSDLSLEVWSGSQLLASSDEAECNVEVVRFRAPRDETLEVRVTAKSLEVATVPFAIAVTTTDLPYTEGSMTTYGKSCLGTRADQDVSFVIPPSAATSMQSSSCRYFTSNLAQRTQCLIDASLLPASFAADGLAFRLDERAPTTTIRDHSVEIEVSMGYAPHAARYASTQFASNVKSAQVVFTRRRLKLPNQVQGNSDPRAFDVHVPFDRPFRYVASATQHLLFDATIAGEVNRVYQYVDAVDSTNAESSGLAMVHSLTANATVGSLFTQYGPVIALTTSSLVRTLAPVHWGVGTPNVSRHYSLEFADFPSNTLVVEFFGFSRTSWNSVPLPFDMTLFNAPGCWLWTGLDLNVALVASAAGHGCIGLTVPSDRSIIGAELFSQVAGFDPKANALGMTFTNGVAIRVGG